ncbi:hypothetical protein ACWGE0_21660 [Lentzea sp. NPDC054927]
MRDKLTGRVVTVASEASRDPQRGASIITRLATDPAFATTTGGRSADVQRELWEATEKLLQLR